jgi:hypothetical protein
MPTLAHSLSTLQTETCSCGLCGATFADPLAWAAHRPWKNRWARDRCRWPRSLYASPNGWALRPAAVAEVTRIETGPADDWKARPATPVAVTFRKRRGGHRSENTPSNGAGSSVPLAANSATEARA